MAAKKGRKGYQGATRSARSDSDEVKAVKEQDLVDVPGFNDIDENDLGFKAQELLKIKTGH